MRAIFLAAVAAVVGCQAARSPAAEPVPAAIEPAVYLAPRREQVAVDNTAPAPIQLVSDEQPAQFPLARGMIMAAQRRVPNPFPRLSAPVRVNCQTPTLAPPRSNVTVIQNCDTPTEDRPAEKSPEKTAEKLAEKDDTLGIIALVGFLVAIAVAFLARTRASIGI